MKEMQNLREKRKKYLVEREEKEEFLLELEKKSKKIFEEKNDFEKVFYIKEKNMEKIAKGLEFLRGLVVLSKVFVIKESEYFQNKEILKIIQKGLKRFLKEIYNKTEGEYSNWWHWEIGYPLELIDIITLLYEELEIQLIKTILETTKFFQPDPAYSGKNPQAIHPRGNPLRLTTAGNRVDTVKISLLRGIVLEDIIEIKKALWVLPEVWKLKELEEKNEGELRDGFYPDGSFLQHGSIPYTGTYGNVLLKGVGEILYLIKGSFIDDYLKNKEEIYERVFTAFEPLFFKGGISDIVNGRAVSRDAHWDKKIGKEVLNSILLLSKSAQSPYKKKLIELLKREKKEVQTYSRKIFCFNYMGRIFLRDGDYALGLALHSEKIGNYETMNGENTEGWFTGDGAYYFYNKDNEQYKNYWNCIDMRYIPGTIEVKMDMKGIETQKNYETTHTKTKWAEGVEKNGYAVAAMEFLNFSEELSSKKTWFFIPGGIIFREDCIKSSKEIYYTLFHRKLSGKEKILIDGKNLKNLKYLKYSGYINEIRIDELIFKIEGKNFIQLEIDNLFFKGVIPITSSSNEKKIFWEMIYNEEKYNLEKKNIIIKTENDIYILENKKDILCCNWQEKKLKISSKILF